MWNKKKSADLSRRSSKKWGKEPDNTFQKWMGGQQDANWKESGVKNSPWVEPKKGERHPCPRLYRKGKPYKKNWQGGSHSQAHDGPNWPYEEKNLVTSGGKKRRDTWLKPCQTGRTKSWWVHLNQRQPPDKRKANSKPKTLKKKKKKGGRLAVKPWTVAKRRQCQEGEGKPYMNVAGTKTSAHKEGGKGLTAKSKSQRKRDQAERGNVSSDSCIEERRARNQNVGKWKINPNFFE